MERMTVDEVRQHFETIVDRVDAEGLTVELERDHRVVARLVPGIPSSGMTMMEFGEFLASLPSLGDDSEAFERDIEEMRTFQLPERDPWQS